MDFGKRFFASLLLLFPFFEFPAKAFAAEQPIAIFHAFNQQYRDVEQFVCTLADQGYSHVQISPAQKSTPRRAKQPNETDEEYEKNTWYLRYQPVDYAVIDGLGTEEDLKTLTTKAHGCNVKIIADVVFNQMITKPQGYDFNDSPTVDGKKLTQPCDIGPNDYGDRDKVVYCRLLGMPDVNFTNRVKAIQKAHLKKLIDLGVDGFRFDAAKHMPSDVVKEYIDYINQESGGRSWNYLEVIEDNGTKAENYNWIAAVEDFILYNSMKTAFSYGGDLRSLQVPVAVQDSRSVVFGRNHDQITGWTSFNTYTDPTDSYLATAYVLARQQGTPLVLRFDNLIPYVPTGVKFRQIMTQRGAKGLNVKDQVLKVIDSQTVLIMERGSEGFFVENKSAGKFDTPTLDLTLTTLEGCYRELRNNFTVAIEKRDNGKKYVTQWGSQNRGGMEVQGRDALYFIREPSFNQCSK